MPQYSFILVQHRHQLLQPQQPPQLESIITVLVVGAARQRSLGKSGWSKKASTSLSKQTIQNSLSLLATFFLLIEEFFRVLKVQRKRIDVMIAWMVMVVVRFCLALMVLKYLCYVLDSLFIFILLFAVIHNHIDCIL